jgi:ubiquitin-like 1-activating enzyme E1 B
LLQLFGEDDPDQNVSPDTEDPEAAGDQAGEAAAQREVNGVSIDNLSQPRVGL